MAENRMVIVRDHERTSIHQASPLAELHRVSHDAVAYGSITGDAVDAAHGDGIGFRS